MAGHGMSRRGHDSGDLRPVVLLLASTANRRTTQTDDRRLVQRAGLALPAAVLVLGLVSPPADGRTLEHVSTYSLLLPATALVDQTAPPASASPGQPFGCLPR